MNANEVISALAGGGAHPNDHVNMGQSSNDVFPSAVHLAALDRATNELLPALKQLERSLARKARRFKNVVKSGRTHLMDAVPGDARPGVRRLRRADAPRPGAHRGGAGPRRGRSRSAARRPAPVSTPTRSSPRRSAAADQETGLKIEPPADPFEAQANRDALVELSGALKVVAVSLTKIAQDIALMGSGPRAGIGEMFLPELQKGSSIMPGKVNPVLPEVVLQVCAQVIGNDTAVTVGGMQGQFELNVRIPLIARNLLQSIHLLSTASVAFAEKCVDGIEANQEGCKRSAESTLAAATALNEQIGYDKGTAIVKKAAASRAAAARRRARGRRRARALRRDDRPAPDRRGQPGLSRPSGRPAGRRRRCAYSLTEGRSPPRRPAGPPAGAVRTSDGHLVTV